MIVAARTDSRDGPPRNRRCAGHPADRRTRIFRSRCHQVSEFRRDMTDARHLLNKTRNQYGRYYYYYYELGRLRHADPLRAGCVTNSLNIYKFAVYSC